MTAVDDTAFIYSSGAILFCAVVPMPILRDTSVTGVQTCALPISL